MLPDIDGEKAVDPFGHRRHRIGGLDHRQLAGFGDQPGPAGAELGLAGFRKLGDQFCGRTEIAGDGAGQFCGRLGLGGRQAAPVEIVIPHLAGIVEDLLFLIVARFRGRLNDLLQFHVGEFGFFHQRIERVHIGLVMLVVMKRDSARRYRRFQRGVIPRQCGEFERTSHVKSPRTERARSKSPPLSRQRANLHNDPRATPKIIVVIAAAKDSDFVMNREFDERDCHSTFAPLSRKRETCGVGDGQKSGGSDARL